MYLKYAISDGGELVYIEQVRRGKTALHCPYCGGLLTAKKGQLVAAHFAHTDETCRQVERDQDLDLPTYDNFTLQLSGRVLEALRAFDERDDHSNRGLLEAKELISFNRFARSSQWELTKAGKVPFGKLSLMLFCEFQEPRIAEKHDHLAARASDVYKRPAAAAGMDINTALADLRIYRAQWRRILSLTLYFISINGGQYHKIGVTSRSMDERLAEIRTDLLPLLGQASIEVVDTFERRGNVELYFKHRYAASAAQLGVLTEYFQFSDPKPVISDLRRMKEKTLSPVELAVLEGQPADIERRIEGDEIEARRRAGIVKGIERAKARGEHIGRHALSDDQFIRQYDAVATALASGLSLRKTAALTGVAVNTVRKVQQLIRVHPDTV